MPFGLLLFLMQADYATCFISFPHTKKLMDSGYCVCVYYLWFFLLGSPVTISIQMTISLYSGRTRRTYLVITLPSLSLPPNSMLESCFYIEKLYTFTKEISTNRRIFKLVLLRFDFLKEKIEKLTLKVTEISGGHRNSIVLSCPTQPVPDWHWLFSLVTSSEN